MNASLPRGRARRKNATRLKPPLRQGNLDALCGIYAIVNAFTYARRDRPIRHFPNAKLFAKLINEAERVTGSASFIADGLSYRAMEALVEAALRYYKNRGHGFTVAKCKAALISDVAPSWKAIEEQRLAWFEHASQRDGIAVILDIQAPWIWHWSVLAGVQEGRVLVYDSFGMRSIAVEHVAGWRAVLAR